MRATFSISEEMECRVWHRYKTDPYKLLTEPNKTLQESGVYHEEVNCRIDE